MEVFYPATCRLTGAVPYFTCAQVTTPFLFLLPLSISRVVQWGFLPLTSSLLWSMSCPPGMMSPLQEPVCCLMLPAFPGGVQRGPWLWPSEGGHGCVWMCVPSFPPLAVTALPVTSQPTPLPTTLLTTFQSLAPTHLVVRSHCLYWSTSLKRCCKLKARHASISICFLTRPHAQHDGGWVSPTVCQTIGGRVKSDCELSTSQMHAMFWSWRTLVGFLFSINYL